MDVILDKQGQVLQAEISGEIKMVSALNAGSHVRMWMHLPHPFWDYSVHESLMDSLDSIEN